MSSNPRSQPASKPSLAQKFGRELEKHINFADKLSRNLLNQNQPSNRTELPKDQTPQDIVEPPKDLSHGAPNRMNIENQQNIADLKQNNLKKEVRESGVSESVKAPQFPESRKQSRNINSSAGSKRSLDRSKGSRKMEKPDGLENNSYMLSNVRKTLSFKNKIIDDSMQRLKSSGSHVATRNTVLKSTPSKIQENIPQKKRNNSQASNKQPVPSQKINFTKRNSVQESSNEGMSVLTQIQRRTSHPDNETSLRSSLMGFDAVKPLESVSNDINVSHVAGIEEQLQEKAAENRSFGLNENVPVEDIKGVTQQFKAAHENYEQDTNNENNRINAHFDVSIQRNESPEASNQFFKSQGSQKSKKTSSEKINEYMENSLDLQGEVLERVPRAHIMKKETERNPINMTHDEALGFSSFSKDFDRTGSVDWFHSNALSIEKAKDEAREEEKLEASVLKDEGSLEKQLEEAVYKIDIKTFLTLRSIIKPHRAVLLCCEGLIRLFAGIEDIPAHFSSKENFDWSEIKALFTNPIQFVSLVSSFKSFVYGGKVRPQRIENLELTLSKIEVHLDVPNLEAFEQIYRFLGLAMKFYRDCEINNTIPEFIEEEPKQVRPEPVSYTPNDVRPREVEKSQKPRDIQRKKDIQTLEEKNKHKGLSNVNASFSNEKDDRKVKARSVSKSPVKSVQGKVVQSAVKRLTQSKERELQKEESVRIDDEAEVSEVDELKDDIETGERKARDYRSKVKRMLADHDRFVKKQLKEQADLEDEWNRACEIEDWQKTNELLNQQANNEKELKHIRNVEYIMEKKEAMEQKIKEEKENQNEVLLESLQDHYYQSYMIQQKKEEQQKDLQEKCQNVWVNRAEKKQKEALDSASKKAELDKNRRDHYASRKIDVEIEKNKWQNDFLMLSKLLGNGK